MHQPRFGRISIEDLLRILLFYLSTLTIPKISTKKYLSYAKIFNKGTTLGIHIFM